MLYLYHFTLVNLKAQKQFFPSENSLANSRHTHAHSHTHARTHTHKHAHSRKHTHLGVGLCSEVTQQDVVRLI